MFDAADAVVILVPARAPVHSVVGEVRFPRFEPTPAVKKPSAMSRPVSQIRGHYCPGVSKSVPADGDSSSSCSGSTIPSFFSSHKHIRQTMIREFAGGGYSTVRDQPA